MGAPLTLALQPGSGAPAETEPWVTADQLADCIAADIVDLESVCQVASEILFLLSGRKYGVRHETVRPVGPAAVCVGPRAGIDTVRSSEIRLHGPVRQVTSVLIDGAVLDPSAYTLYDNRTLVRTDGYAWPVGQSLQVPLTQPGTFAVTYEWGQSVPPGGLQAAALFACELAKYIAPDEVESKLPDRLVALTRQGVSQTVMDPNDFLTQARTGLYIVDTWLAAVNPKGHRRRASINSPDGIRLVRVTPPQLSAGEYPDVRIAAEDVPESWTITIRSNNVALDVSQSIFTAPVFNAAQVQIGSLAVDLSGGATGKVKLTVTPQLFALLGGISTWKLQEHTKIKDTVTNGRIIKEV